ncbi:MAG TPA: hypothetical protein QF703_03720 [Candidatus Thalassarchaeaceae archaeon]|nr:hypothetical protein [Candidatus Thalassarchaeaceae archaeon]
MRVARIDDPENVEWRLPPSKSHMIRWLILAAQSRGVTDLHFLGPIGDDIASMGLCLEEMGVAIEREDSNWRVVGVENGLSPPERNLNCGNSGTTARILMAVGTRFGSSINIDGDQSLRGRDFSALVTILERLGCEVNSGGFPYTISGPIQKKTAILDQSNSSQSLTALIIGSTNFPNDIEISIIGKPVSRGYLDLTINLCRECGWPGSIEEDRALLGPWEVSTPDLVNIPGEHSLIPMSMLFDKLHGVSSLIDYELELMDPKLLMAINQIKEDSGISIDLSDASDIMTPATAIISLGNGGSITGVAHSANKESNRIITTIELLKTFGIEAFRTDDGLEVGGNQCPKSPEKVVETFGDHRIAMTAIVLASAVGAEIEDCKISSITDPGFLGIIGQ